MSKRIISLALTVIMLAALLPAAFLSASAAETLPKYRAYYSFKSTDTLAYGSLAQITFDNTLGVMEFAGASADIENAAIAARGLRFGTGWVPNNAYKNANWFAINFNNPVAGDYNLTTVSFYEAVGDGGGQGAKSNIYVIPSEVKLDANNIEEYTTKENFVGMVDFKVNGNVGASATQSNINGTTPIPLVQGVNTIIFSAVEPSEHGYAQPLTSFRFETYQEEGATYESSYGYSYVGKVIDQNIRYDKGASYASLGTEHTVTVSFFSAQSAAKVSPTTREGLGDTRYNPSSSKVFSKSGNAVRAVGANLTGKILVDCLPTSGSYRADGSTTENTSIWSPDIVTIEKDIAEAYLGESSSAQHRKVYVPMTSTTSVINGDVQIYYANRDGSFVSNSSRRIKADLDTGIVHLSASKTDASRGNFLYWVKGLSANRQVLSTNPEFDYLPAGTASREYLIAVYDYAETANEAATERAEFYNADGQYIKTIAAENGSVTLPDYPTMNGKTAIGWLCDYDYNEYKKDDEVALDGKAWTFVAMYDEDEIFYDCEVTVTGSTTDGTLEKKFGDEVALTANVPDGKKFKWWLKDGEIVSLNPNYTFYAWEDCTVEAVFGDVAPLFKGPAIKIIVDTFGNDANNIMVEFTGLENAAVVEKGIKIGENKYKSGTASNQMMIYDDTGAGYTNAIGYVIFREGTRQIELTGTAPAAE